MYESTPTYFDHREDRYNFSQPNPSEFKPEPETIDPRTAYEIECREYVLKRASENELFAKVHSALEVIPPQQIYENLFQISCSISEAFSYRDTKRLIQFRVKLEGKYNLSGILDKKKFGHFNYVFKIASKHGWSGTVPSGISKNKQPFESIASHSKGKLISLNTRYLTDEMDEFKDLAKINVIQSLQGTGKTEFFLKKFKGEKIIYCCPLRVLVRQACDRFQKAGIVLSNYEILSNVSSA